MREITNQIFRKKIEEMYPQWDRDWETTLLGLLVDMLL